MKKILAPSILSADFRTLGQDIQTVTKAGAEYVHIDVMDGEFVPSISFGMPVIRSVRGVTDKVFDVHLMIVEPDRHIPEFAACGADVITVHAEVCRHLDRTIALIHSLGKKAGVALNPATDLSVLNYVLDQVDMVLLMTVNPGFGGQKYIPYCTEKIRRLKAMISERGLDIPVEVDGGINSSTIREVLDAGADICVAGSAVFGGDAAENVKEFLKVMEPYQV
jgi:ribulose-phosphate 3-epimerase